MKAGLEKIFLKYANTSLRENPKYLFELDRIINDYFIVQKVRNDNDLINLIKHILNIASYNDAKSAKKYIDGVEDPFDKMFIPMPFRAVYKHENNKCNCFLCSIIYFGSKMYWGAEKPYWVKTTVEEKKVPKCYECTQDFFIKLLSEIIEGKKYSEMANSCLHILFRNAYARQKIDLTIIPTNKEPVFNEILKEEIFLYEDILSSDYIGSGFNQYILYSFVYSLSKFLQNNDRRKLKFCPYCHKFFITNHISRKMRCYSNECKKAYWRETKQKQRSTDPVKYI